MRIEDQLTILLIKKNKDEKKIADIISNENFDMDYFLWIIDKNLVKPMVLSELIKYKIPDNIKQEIKNHARQALSGNIKYAGFMEKEIKKIKEILTKNSIEMILLKGLTLGDKELRMSRDIDILIHDRDLERAIELLSKSGYEYISNKINYLLKKKEKNNIELQKSWNNQYHLKNKKNGILLELHINLFERARAYNIDLNTLLDNIGSFWERKVLKEGIGVYSFRNEDLLLLMCLHSAIKRSPASNNFVLRNLADLQDLCGSRIDWNNFTETALSLKVSPFVLFALTLTKKILGVTIPEESLQKLNSKCSGIDKFMIKIHSNSLKSLYRSSLFYSNLYTLLCPFVYSKNWSSRLKSLFFIHLIFPPKWKMEQFFNIKADSPFIYFTYLLNPLRWLLLLINSIYRNFTALFSKKALKGPL